MGRRADQLGFAAEREALPVVGRDDLLVVEAHVLRAPVAVGDDDLTATARSSVNAGCETRVSA